MCVLKLSVTTQEVASRSGQENNRFYECECFTKSLTSQMELNLELPAKEFKYGSSFFPAL